MSFHFLPFLAFRDLSVSIVLFEAGRICGSGSPGCPIESVILQIVAVTRVVVFFTILPFKQHAQQNVAFVFVCKTSLTRSFAHITTQPSYFTLQGCYFLF